MPESPRNSFAGQVSTLLGRVSLNPRGEYAGGQTYDRLDIVQYNGSGWICLKDSTIGVTPVEGDNWMRFADNGGAATVEAAQEYANQAKASQTAAGESASAAEQSASEAETAKTGAETALASAETAKEDAASSATAAAGSATEAAESAQTAKEYSGNPPVIDEETGNWQTWDAESGGYTDTGKPSRGEKGERGEQGPPGKDGAGSGDMEAATYDPQGKRQDIFKAIEDGLNAKQDTLTFDEIPQEKSDNPVKSSGIYDALQNVTIDVDPEPIPESDNPVSSGGTYTALQNKADLGEDGKVLDGQLPEHLIVGEGQPLPGVLLKLDADTLEHHSAAYFATAEALAAQENEALTDAEVDAVWDEVFGEVSV